MTSTKVCNTWAEKLAARHPDDLSPAERAELDAHVASCPNCGAARQEYDLLTSHIRALPAVTPLAQAPSEFLRLNAQLERSEPVNVGSPWQTFLEAIQRPFVRKFIGVGVLIAASIMIASLALFNSLNSPLQKSISNQPNTTGVENYTSCLLLPNGTNASCVAQYTGTIHNPLSNTTLTMRLLLQQKQKTISGSCILPLPLGGTGPITGSVDSQGGIQFTVRFPPSIFSVHFTGVVQTDGSIRGTYTTSDNQTGTWLVRRS